MFTSKDDDGIDNDSGRKNTDNEARAGEKDAEDDESKKEGTTEEQHKEKTSADNSKGNLTARILWGDRENGSEDKGMTSDMAGWKFVRAQRVINETGREKGTESGEDFFKLK